MNTQEAREEIRQKLNSFKFNDNEIGTYFEIDKDGEFIRIDGLFTAKELFILADTMIETHDLYFL
jgi:hypothetical protein